MLTYHALKLLRRRTGSSNTCLQIGTAGPQGQGHSALPIEFRNRNPAAAFRATAGLNQNITLYQPLAMYWPPLMVITAPVMKAAASEAR